MLIEKYRIERKKDGVGHVTINHDVVILNLLLNRATAEGIISKNSIKDVKPLKIGSKRDRVLSDTETRIC